MTRLEFAVFAKNPQLLWLLIGLFFAGGVLATVLSRQAADTPPQQVLSEGQPTQENAAEGEDSGTQQQIPDEMEKARVQQASLPTFDVLRIEPDGSAVVAGAAPGVEVVELLAGGEVIAKVDTSPNGDFVFALDEPLDPGAYELTLRGIKADGAVITSEEIGIVNVPEASGDSQDVIAMVDREGAAPRILQRGGQSMDEDTAVAVEEPAEETDMAAVEPDAEEVGTDTAPERPADETQAVQTPADEQDVAPVMVQAVDVEGDRLFIAGTGEPGREVNIYIDDELLGTAIVTPEKTFLLEAEKPLADGQYEVRADMLKPDSGEVSRRAAVRLIHETPQLAQQDDTGDGTETADAGQPDRADRDGEEVVAAMTEPEPQVAVPEAGSPQEDTPPVAATGDAEAEAADAQLASDAPADERAPEGEMADTGDETTEELAGDIVMPDQALEDETESETVASADEGHGTTVVAKSEPESRLMQEDEEPVAGGEMAGEGEPVAAEAPAAKEDEAEGTSIVAKTEMEAATESAAPESQNADEMIVTEEEDSVAALPVIRTGDTVIIRRGDNLWRISRRMLGRGIRYTVIFDANRDQIRNPALIYPGQVFDVPEQESGSG